MLHFFLFMPTSLRHLSAFINLAVSSLLARSGQSLPKELKDEEVKVTWVDYYVTYFEVEENRLDERIGEVELVSSIKGSVYSHFKSGLTKFYSDLTLDVSIKNSKKNG
jgi:hypothetical protein